MEFVEPIRDKNVIREIKKYLLVKDSSGRNYTLFVLGINVGLRISDLLLLKVQDVKGDYINIREKKTGKAKKVKLNKEAKKAVSRFIYNKQDDEWLFSSRKGYAAITRTTAYRILVDVQMEFGLGNLGTHSLRKTFGYHFYKEYKDVAALQTIFNHSDPKTTLRYIGIEQDGLDSMIDKFGL